MNTMRSGTDRLSLVLRRASAAGCDATFRLLPELTNDDVALQSRQEVDDEPAVEMIDLVLDRRCQQSLRFQLLQPPLRIEEAHVHTCRSLDLDPHIGNRKATLLVGPLF